MKKIAFLSVAALVISLVAGPAMASNTGFKINLSLRAANNFVSTPYFYFPNGDINAPEQNAQDACDDMAVAGGGDCTLVNITHFTASGAPFTATCGSPFQNFVLVAGEGLVVNAQADCTANIVGSHDDNYTFGRGSSTVALRTGNTLVSVPYHVVAVNAQDLCTFTNDNFGGSLVNVTHFTTSGAPFTATCGSPFQNFDMVPGEGIFFNASAPMDIQFETY